MAEFLSLFTQFNCFSTGARLLLSGVLGGLIGIERSRHGRAAGLRTHVLVCIGACMTSMMSLYVYYRLEVPGDVFRISAQVISGIGFLGAGTILIRHSSVVTGLTTAAGIWCTGAIGVALGYGFYEGALICAVIAILTNTVLSTLEKTKKHQEYYYVELTEAAFTTDAVQAIRGQLPEVTAVNITSAKSGLPGAMGLRVFLNREKSQEEYLSLFRNLSGVSFVITE